MQRSKSNKSAYEEEEQANSTLTWTTDIFKTIYKELENKFYAYSIVERNLDIETAWRVLKSDNNNQITRKYKGMCYNRGNLNLWIALK